MNKFFKQKDIMRKRGKILQQVAEMRAVANGKSTAKSAEDREKMKQADDLEYERICREVARPMGNFFNPKTGNTICFR